MAPFNLATDRIQTLTTAIAAQQKNQAFGYTNALLDLIPRLKQPVLHFWTMPPTVIMGIKDKRLPYLTDAVSAVHGYGYDHVLRNSGGLAVVADGGILNVSLFQPLTTPAISVAAAYDQMLDLMAASWPELDLAHHEITRSYCPGDYDLSVNNRKIAGISQRRSPHAMVTMLYLSVTGDQLTRGSLVRDFYRAGLGDHTNDWNFPDVDPEVMTTVADLLGHSLTVDDAQQRILSACTTAGLAIGQGKLTAAMATPWFQDRLAHATALMARRQPI